MTKKIFQLFWHHTWRYRGRALFIILGIVIANAAEIATPWFMRTLIDTLADATHIPTATTHALTAIAIIATLQFIAWAAWRSVGFLTADFQPRVMQDLEERGFEYLLGHSFSFFTNQFAGSLVRKVRRLSRAYERFADEMQFRFIPIVVILTGTLIALGIRFPLLALIFFLWVILFVYANYRIARWVLRIDVIRAAKDSKVTAVLADALTNNATIKLFTGENIEQGFFHAIEEKFRILQTRAWNRNEIAFAIQSLLIFGINIALLVIGIRLWAQGILTVGDLVLIQGVLIMVIGKLWDISRAFHHIFESFADAREMLEIMEEPHDVVDRPRAATLSAPQGKIDFKKVTFHYHHTRRVLNQLAFTIESKEKVAFVGPSGAGKSTIIKLLFRFSDVTSGHIFIDGQDIATVTQQSLREHIALVPQDPILFHRSLMENIRYGRRGASDADVIAAAKKAHCHEFIVGLPKGYNTLVGERGIKLSGGERQRVAIARAILKNPPILVLDEATSSLDSESEHYIQKALHELMKEKTVIVIAHRLSTVMKMDRIIVLEEGKITATGSHAALLKRKGTYRNLWRIQAGGFAKRQEYKL